MGQFCLPGVLCTCPIDGWVLINVIRGGAGVWFGCTGPFKTFQIWWTGKKLQMLNMAANYCLNFRGSMRKQNPKLTLYNLNFCIILLVFIYVCMYVQVCVEKYVYVSVCVCTCLCYIEGTKCPHKDSKTWNFWHCGDQPAVLLQKEKEK